MWVAILSQVQAVTVGVPATEQLASMSSIADVRDYAEVTTTVWNAASGSLDNVSTVRVFGLVSLELFRQ